MKFFRHFNMFCIFNILQELEIATRQTELEMRLRAETENNDGLVSELSSPQSLVCDWYKKILCFFVCFTSKMFKLNSRNWNPILLRKVKRMMN